MRPSVLVVIAACGGGAGVAAQGGAPVAPAETAAAPPPAVAVADAGVAAILAPDADSAAITLGGSDTRGFDDSNIYGGLLGNAGSGGGNAARRPPPEDAHLVLGQPTLTGNLDRAIVRRYLKRNIQKLTYCYEKELLVKPGLAGTVTLAFTIAADGTVSHATGSGVDGEVSSCMAGVVADIVFPKPKSDKVVVSYPFELVLPKPDH